MNKDIQEIQSILIKGGFSVGKSGADGWYGNDTRNALIDCVNKANGNSMKLTLEQLNKIFPTGASGRNAKFIDPLNALFAEREINTVNRVAGFLSQIGVESEELLYTRELGNSAYFNKYDIRFAPQKAKDLGNTQPGDGAKFKGRGLIQVTGRANYTACGKALGIDLLNTPELLEQPKWAVESAGWYWGLRNINALCDANDITRITKAVNGGTNHLDRRTAYYNKAKSVLS
ncbi:endolysin [Pantoea phage Phynn]|nr:endolysin [Pantoea phage Phynn]